MTARLEDGVRDAFAPYVFTVWAKGFLCGAAFATAWGLALYWVLQNP